ncbi:MAG: YqgE/AlgH family protein [Chitinophagaceae bacterium]|nr:YqgE/AlgH family protein [Chitinophagaceae bacterium]
MEKTPKGTLLIANPFLKDPNFLRTVVMLCDHEEEGSFGFVLNRPFDMTLGEVVPDLKDVNFPLYIGGPVQLESLHFVHELPELIEDGDEILPGIFYGGNFEALKIHLENGTIPESKIRFFIGYSGWSGGQLESELTEDSWITTMATRKLIFDTDADQVWKESLRKMGGEYEKMINYPIDPQLN